jgi:hypothetical protein
MFIIAGISPKTKTIDQTPRICPSCGLAQAYMKRVDHYFNLFFIPLIRVKKGDPFVFCNRCNNTGYIPREKPPPGTGEKQCRACGRSVRSEFLFCPFCGKKL